MLSGQAVPFSCACIEQVPMHAKGNVLPIGRDTPRRCLRNPSAMQRSTASRVPRDCGIRYPGQHRQLLEANQYPVSDAVHTTHAALPRMVQREVVPWRDTKYA